MRWLDVLAVACAAGACGRIAFAPQDGHGDDAEPGGHDEDGDGVPDARDLCPHLAGSQLDLDLDGIGDDCDPDPSDGRQRLALFSTMQPGDQPFRTTSGTWTQLADAIRFDGIDNGHLELDMAFTDVRVAIGIDVVQSLAPAAQHQLALGVFDADPAYYFVELNQGPGYNDAAVTYFDGQTYQTVDAKPLTPSGVHTGAVFLQNTVWGPPVGTHRLDGGWVGEIYEVTAMTPSYASGTGVELNVNNLVIEVRYAWIVATP